MLLYIADPPCLWFHLFVEELLWEHSRSVMQFAWSFTALHLFTHLT